MDYYNKEIKQIYKELNTSEKGLTKAQAHHKLGQYGENTLQTKVYINPFKIFIDQFKSFIVYILLFAVAFSLISGHIVDAVIILIILIANALIGFFQELSAHKSLEALKRLDITQAKVFRDNNLIDVDSKYLVPGDIIHLESGDKVPADCRLIEARKLKVNEAALTGESLTVNKIIEPILKEVQISDQKNMIFSATIISEGSARAIVVNTGMNTQIGKITSLIKDVQEEMTPLQKRLDDFGKKLSYVVIAISLFVILMLILTQGFSKDNFLTFSLIGISLAVAAVPTALPAVVTIALSIGVKRLVKKKALVRKLSSVETLGSCNVICTDKTGTLTQNEMTVINAWTLNEKTQITGIGYQPKGEIKSKINPLLFKIGFACNNASVYLEENEWKISGDPTEAALITSARKANLEEEWVDLDELPFDSERKMMSVLVEEKNKLYTYSKGSTTHILDKCSHVLINGKIEKMTSQVKKKILSQNDIYSSQALRVLAFAYRPIKNKSEFVEKDLIFVGLQAMQDPPRPDVIESLKKTKEAGIRVIMITGDYKETAKAIGMQIGIEGEILTGQELDTLSEEQLIRALNNNTNIFARVIPEHKQKIVAALQKMGNIVAMTGDGVNDAPALKKANIGIAVGSGTDVAKEAADFVLLDDSFTHIVNAIEEGRGIYDNIQKSIMLLLSGNLAEVLIVFLAVIFGFNLPLTAILLLWINLVTDGAPALAYSVDPYGKNIMKRKPIESNSNILPKTKLLLLLTLGTIGSLIGLSIFSFYGGNGNVGDSFNHILAQTMVFNFIVVYEVVLSFIIRKQYGVKFFSNVWLWAATVFTILLQVIVMYTPLRDLFKLTALGLIDIAVLIFGGLVFYMFYLVYNLLLEPKYKESN